MRHHGAVLSHVALTVADRERSARFYARHFGLADRVHDDPHLLIIGSSDGSLLALSEGEVPRGLPRTKHFGFRLPDRAAVHALRARLREAAVPETEWQVDRRFARVQLCDPDGYRVEAFAAGPPAGGDAAARDDRGAPERT